MIAVAVELLTRPPEPGRVPEAGTPTALAPMPSIELVADTDTLLTMCACRASGDQLY